MAGNYSEEQVREIRERCDIVELVGTRVQLKRSGANHTGLCPFHQEKTPSFSVNSAKQIFHCFGCGVGGDAYSFLMQMDGLAFPDAVRALAERVGIQLEVQEADPETLRRREERERLLRINEVACGFYHSILLEAPEGAPGRRYLRQRGYDGETARRFRLGFAPAAWDALAKHLEKKGFDAQSVRKVGLIRPRKEGAGDYDLFRNRLLFPIQELQGRVVAFGGRALDDSLPKYINSPESPVYHKGGILYGLYQGREVMRKQGEGILVEGYFDVLALHRAGFEQVAAPCGTALTEDQAQLLKRYCGRVLTLFDQDAAGEKASYKAMEVFLQTELPAAMISLEQGEDPDSFLRSHSAEDFAEKVLQARPLLEGFMEKMLREAGDGIEEKARAAEKVMAVIRQVRSEIERSLYLKSLAARSGIDQELLARMTPKGAPKKAPATRDKPQEDRNGPPPPDEEPYSGFDGRDPDMPRPSAFASAPRKVQRSMSSRMEKAQEIVLKIMARSSYVRQRVREAGAENLFADALLLSLAQTFLSDPAPEEWLDTGALCARIDEEHKSRLSSILAQDAELLEEDFVVLFDDCLRAVEKGRMRLRKDELMRLQDEASRSGDIEALSGYLMELTKIKKILQNL